MPQYSPDRRSRSNHFVPPIIAPRGLLAVNDAMLELFLAACGSSEPLRLGVGQREELLSETRLFRQPFLVIGRRPESDLVLDHWQVSRRHAYLQLIEGRYYCVDLGAGPGPTAATRPSGRAGSSEGRAIQIGPYAVRPESPTTAPKPAGPPLAVTWELPGRAIGQAVWRMDRHLALIGRSPACKIRIVESDVSKFHCSVVLTPHGVWVVDLLGQNGVLVNDEPVRCARIEDGDELRIGRHALRARYDSPPLPLPLPRTEALAGPTNPGSLATVVPTHLAPMPGQALSSPAGIMPPGGQDFSTMLAGSAGPSTLR